MVDIRSLSVRVGDLVIPAWRRLVAALQTLAILPGVGTLITRTPRGSIVNARAWLVGFTGSFAVNIVGARSVRVSNGFLNGEQVADTGPQGLPIPIDESLFTDLGRSWICLEVVVDATGVLQKERTRIVQADHPTRTAARLIGHHPLAVFNRGTQTRGFGTLHRIAYFDLQHRYNPGTRRHFFWV
jgi:hypothetical protein